ncbi:MAG: phage tail tape measure protein, partial [Methanoregulaceae archaeon]|nr:phage tail tape measure protein [Methanoregulaceae archaeon]
MEVGRVEAGLYLSDKGFDSGLATAGSKLDTFGSKIDSVAQKAGQIGQTLTMGLTLPIAGAAAGVVKLAGDFQQSMANVASVTGGGVEAQKALSAAAREAGATTVFSASQAADAMYFMASAGWKDQQIVAGLNDTLKLAAAGGKDLAFTSDLMTATISQFGLEAGDAGRVANVFAAATSNSQANLDKLAYSMRYVGPVADSLGWSLEESTGALMGLYNAGFKGEQAGTVLRGALSALLKPSDAAAETLKKLGLSIEDVNPATHSLAEIVGVLESKNLSAADAVAIFGQEAGPGMLALLGQGQAAIEGYTASITGTSKATEMMETQTNTLWGALKQLRSAGEELALVFGDVLIPPLTSLVKDTITPFVRKLGEMDSGTVKLIATIAGLAAVVGPALILFSHMIPALALIVGAVGALVSPLGLVAAAFAALAGYEVHKHFDAIASAFGHIKDVAFELFGALSQGNITEAFDILRAEAGNFVKYLSDVDWGEMFRGLQSDTKSAFKKAVSAAQSVWSGLRGIANDVASWLRAVDWGGVWDTVVLGAYTAFGALHDLGDYILEGFQSIDWGGIWTELRGIGSYIVSSLKSVDWSSIASTIGSGLRSAFETLTDLGGAVVEKLKEIDWRGVGDTIIGLIGQGFGALSGIGSKLFDAITSYDWSSLSDRITSGLADVGGAIGSYIKEKLAAVNWSDVGHRILDGIKTVFGAARDLGDYLAEAIRAYDWSPVGEKIAEWLKEGVQKGWDLLKWIGEKISGISTSDATSTFSGWFNAVKGAFSEFWSGFSEEMTGGAGWKAAFIELFWEAFDYVVGLLGRWGSEIKNSIKGHLAEILTKVDLWTIDFINLWIYAANGALDSAYNFRDWISPIFDEAVGAVTKKLDEIGATKAFEDLKAAAEAPIATVKGWVDALKDAIQGLIDTASNVANVGGYLETLASTLGIGAQWYESVGRSTGDMGGRHFMTEAEKAAWEEEHPAWKLQVSKNQSNFSLPTTQTQVPGIPQAEVSLSGENVVFTTDQGTSTATQGQLGYVDYSKLDQILEGTPGYGAIWPQGGWLTKLLTGTGNADYSALFGEVAGSVIRPEGRTYLSPVGSLGYEKTLAGWQDRLGYKIDAQTDEVTSSWKSTGDAVHSDLEAMRAEEAATAANTGSIAGTIPSVASATTGTEANTAAFPAG